MGDKHSPGVVRDCFVYEASKPRAKSRAILVFLGSPTWIRTRDLRINSPSLYRLSYRGPERRNYIGRPALSATEYEFVGAMA